MKTHTRSTLAAVAASACTLALVACAAVPGATEAENRASATKALEAFPATLAGHQRYVIELQPKANEDQRQVELIGGKQMLVDCNIHRLGGEFEARDVTGWGYTYWVLQSQGGPGMSTMMACPDEKKHEEFVVAQSTLVRYNSKLPVVVFVPDGMTLRWRVWHAGKTQPATAK